MDTDSFLNSRVLRLLFVLPQAILVTSLLLLLMVGLVEFADKGFSESKRIEMPDILMSEEDITIQRIVQKPERPELDETPPPEIPKQDFDEIDGDAQIGQVAFSQIKAKLDLTIGAGLQASDGEYLPIVKVAPVYPRRALARGIEGYVVLEYTVTKQGTVKDPVVIESKPNRIFDKVATKSALRYKYKPRVIDGEPVEVPNVRTKITFKLSQ